VEQPYQVPDDENEPCDCGTDEHRWTRESEGFTAGSDEGCLKCGGEIIKRGHHGV